MADRRVIGSVSGGGRAGGSIHEEGLCSVMACAAAAPAGGGHRGARGE